MSKKRNKSQQTGIHPTVWVAIVGGIVSITIAILGFPPVINRLNSMWNPTHTATPLFAPSIIPESPSPTATAEFITQTHTPTITLVVTQTDLPTPNAVMIPQLRFSASEGKAPLSVNFNAEGSFVDVKGGADLLCNFENVCQYTWSVRLGSTMVYEPAFGGSKFSYTFQKKGEYIVVLTVCRGEFCESTAVVITVR